MKLFVNFIRSNKKHVSFIFLVFLFIVFLLFVKDVGSNESSANAKEISDKLALEKRSELVDTKDSGNASLENDDSLHHVYSGFKSAKVGGMTLDEIIEAAELTKFTYIGSKDIKKLTEKVVLIFKGYSFRRFANNDGQGGLVITKPGGRVFICFKGTKNLKDALVDLKMIWKEDQILNASFHKGFIEVFRELYPQVQLHLEGIARERGVKVQDLDIVAVGHSMGAGLAQITVKQLVEIEGVKNIHGVFIAPPKVMDYKGAKKFNEIVGNRTVSIVQDFYDFIPKIGPVIFGGYHVGERLVIPKLSKDRIHRLSSYSNALKVLRYHQDNEGWNAKYVHMGDEKSFRKVYKFKNSREDTSQ